ncbi:MAG TPA: response regulator [Aggregatilineaceae bacterium]|nr:response regulator [Aggregatilineaceae bacterium]
MAYILIVDDDWMSREVLQAYLQLGGYKVATASNGVQALAMLQVELPDLVLLDVRMHGMDGYEVCRHIKQDERTCHIQVWLITALSSEEDHQMGLAAGANGFLNKPFDPGTTLARIQSILEA